MKIMDRKLIRYMDALIMLLIFAVLFALPVIFTRIDGEISWRHVQKIWLDHSLLIPLFILNHWLFVPKILIWRRYVAYTLCIATTIGLFTSLYYYRDEILNKRTAAPAKTDQKRPAPVPPYAELLMSSLLIVGVDTGLLFSKKWHENEGKRYLLEQQNTRLQLDILRHQISPHFFMNTLNNIYALIDIDAPHAKTAVMKLSKLMRYVLYENGQGKVKLSKEFEFVQSYIDLMKLRYTDDLTVNLILPETYDELEIPPMLFASYIENAFKHGASYQKDSFITIIFAVRAGKLNFTCSNTNHRRTPAFDAGGLGLRNSKNRLDLIFSDNYSLIVDAGQDVYTVDLEIPL